jgi:hypothetical protein
MFMWGKTACEFQLQRRIKRSHHFFPDATEKWEQYVPCLFLTRGDGLQMLLKPWVAVCFTAY